MNSSTIIKFYHKQDCHLCETMLERLQSFLESNQIADQTDVVMCDIEDNSKWFERYREYVPVLVVNQVEVCHYFFDEDEMSEAIYG